MTGLFTGIKRAYALICSYPAHTIGDEPADYDAYWKEKRGMSLGTLSKWQKRRADFARQHIGTEGASVLDIGCADGAVLAYLKEKGSAGALFGVDVSKEALARATSVGISTIPLDLRSPESWSKLPEADYVLLFETLEHVQDSEKLLRAAFHKARKGVCFSFPNTGFYAHRLRLLLGKFPLQWRVHPGEHVRFWTHRDLRWWMEAQGYNAYTLHSYEGVPFLNRLLPSLFAAGLFVYLPKR